MCTVSLIPLAGDRCGATLGVRMACNRDESRLRPAALPPRIRGLGAQRAVMPIDPVSGGTWIGANDRGIVATLLNVYTRPHAETGRLVGRRSRGEIVPHLLAARTLDGVLESAQRLIPSEYPPFRLVAADASRWFEARSDGAELRLSNPQTLVEPRMFTSSGLGDERVAGPRNTLFGEMFAVPCEQWVAVQDEFHAHRWPDAPHVSVCMERAEALTVSVTTVEIRPSEVRLAYTPGPPGRAAALPALELSVGE